MWIIFAIAFFVALIKLDSIIAKHKEDFINNGVSEKEFIYFRVFNWSYLVILMLLNVPIKQLAFIAFPAPFIVLILIVKCKKLSARLETSGTDRGAFAGEIANKSMWLGIAIGVAIIWTYVWSFIIKLIQIL